MAKEKSIKSQLADLDGWSDTQEKGFDEVDPGKYQVRIEAATINNAKSSGRLQVSWTMVIVNGEFAGRKLFKHDGLDSEEGRSYFRGSLARLGHEWPDDPDDLPEVLEEIINTFAAVTVRKRKDSDQVSTYFDKALDSDDVEVEVTEDESADEQEEKAPKNGGKSKPAKDESEDESADESTDEDGSVEITAAQVREMSKKELKVLVKDNNLDVDLTEDLEDIQAAVISELELTEEAEEEEKSAEEVECTVNFKDKAVDADLAKKFKKLAKAADLDPDDYDHIVDMITELAEFHGVSGEFDKPKKLYDAIVEAAAE